MMKLLSNPFSPYGRKVKIAMAHEGARPTGSRSSPSIPTPPTTPRSTAPNPLAKIPALVVDGQHGHLRQPRHLRVSRQPGAVARAVSQERRGAHQDADPRVALADGILDAALLLVYEKRFRPEEKWHAPWMERQQGKIDRALDHLEKAPPAWGASPDYGHLTLACALGYLDFRHEGKWRAGHPKLVAWLDEFAKAVPAFEATRPKQ